MAYAPPLAALAGALLIAWMGDAATGRRGYFGASLAALTGAACGAFLALRVFAIGQPEDWSWLAWSLIGSAGLLLIYTLFRSKR